MVEKDTQLSTLDVGELDLFVQSMEPWPIEAIGNQAWLDWHIRLQKLNQQAVLEASTMQEELTKEILISYGKLPILVHEAICIQVWRSKIYPKILKSEIPLANTFGIYMVLYHEAATVGLLETVLFHEDGAQCISEVIIDLLHYSIEQLTSLVAILNDGYLGSETKNTEGESILEELERQKRCLQFDISMRCISIVRYLAEHIESTGVGASLSTNIYKTHDLPSLLCHLIQLQPWRKFDDKGNLLMFNYGRWSKPTSEESSQLHRTEAQLWLCFRQLLLEPRLTHYYTIEECRRAAFCSIKENYLKEVRKRSKAISKAQMKNFQMDGSDESRNMAKKLLESYTSDAALALDSGGAKCAKCGDKASKKCSRCKTEWYCGRECQVQQWPKHKDICDQFANLCV
ncbi:zinc finger MYND domain-containing protein 10 isoform X2 [Aricia agestis]|uniref:zinc finger MYND domain-containing protein 10 isoform X2 n=1 Tax=Aricia agestis TaxID=91739 RepID=UPI001C2091FB|nr:zinc finger MYND domain-containing protein 10 isoform X2 [Aricia agestis]